MKTYIHFMMLLIFVYPSIHAEAYSISADWVHINFETRHQTYGVFILPEGYSKVKLNFVLDDGTKILLGNSACRAIKPVKGPQKIKDPDGKYESDVPKGYVGLSICSHTSIMFLLYLTGNDVYDNSRWVLEYEK